MYYTHNAGKQARAKHQIYYGYTLSKLAKAFDETVEKKIAVLGQYLADIRMCVCMCVYILPFMSRSLSYSIKL